MAKSSTKTSAFSGELKNIDLKDIHVDPKWNLRSGAWTADKEFGLLVESIALEGVHTPVNVVPSTIFGDEIKTDKKYVLIAGFRRIYAVLEVNKQKRDGKRYDSVPAIILNVSRDEALLHNLAENTHRQDTSVPDTTFGLMRLNEQLTPKLVAERTGLSQSYVTKLLAIGRGLLPKVFDAWRNSPLKIAIADIDAISKLSKDEQEIAFTTLVTQTKSKTGTTKGARIERALRNSLQFGQTVGKLVGYGYVGAPVTDVADWDLSLATILGGIASLDKVGDDEKTRIVKSFLAGVESGVQMALKPQDNETEELVEEGVIAPEA